jgi:hypothetical protein
MAADAMVWLMFYVWDGRVEWVVSKLAPFLLVLGGALENWPNFQTPLLLMKLWDLLDSMCLMVDLKFEQKNPPGSASSSSKTR